MAGNGIPQPDQIPIPDTSQLPDQSAPNQFAMENANAAMSPQPAPPPTAQPGALKGLLTNFFGGMGRAMMVHAGLPTPEQEAQKQQQLATQQQLAQSEIQYRQAAAQNLTTQNQMVPYQLPDSPDGTPGEVIQIPRKSLGPLAVQQLRNAGKTNLPMATIGPEHAQLLPGIPVGTQVPKALLDRALLNTASRQSIQNNAPEKTPTQIALEIRRDQGDPQAARILARMQSEKIAQAQARGASLGAGRVIPVINPDTETLGLQYAGKAVEQGLVPAVQGGQVMSKQAQFSEMKSASSKLRDSINNLDRDFTPAQIAKLQLAARSPDESVLRTVVDSVLGTENLTPSQQDFVIWLGQMNERLLSLRNVAGMGQGSADLRSAIQATLPNMKVGSKEFALKKMDAVDNQITQLEQGIPKFRGSARNVGGGNVIYARNPKTGERVQSADGGKTWQPAK